MTVQSLVLDPLAAVPGHTLGQIHTHLKLDGMQVSADNQVVIIAAVIGALLALGVAVIGIWKQRPLTEMTLAFLALLTFGAVATFGSSFALGMDVADSYGIGGGAHTIWPGVLYLTSLASLVALSVVLTAAAIRDRRGQAQVARPASA